MTGPLTNTYGFYGDGHGLTNMGGVLLTNYVNRMGDTMTGPLTVVGLTNNSLTTFTPGTEQVLANGGMIGVSNITYAKIKGASASVTLGNPQVALGAAGQVIILQGNDSNNTVTFTNSAQLVLEGAVPFTMSSNDVIQLVCDGNAWVEMYRCDK